MILKKLFKAILLTSSITFSLFSINVLADTIPVYLNNERVEFSNNVFIENERTMVPLRAICEALGYDVGWNNLSREVSVGRPGQRLYILFRIDDYKVKTLFKGDSGAGDGIYAENTIDVAPKIIEGRTYLTLRALVESLDDDIRWDDNSKTIYMTKNPKYDRIVAYNLENIDNNTRNYGYLPQIVNPSDEERKVNESIILRLSDNDKDIILNGKETSVIRNDYSYEIKNNHNNIFSILYCKISTYNKVTEGMNYPQHEYGFYDTFDKNTGKKLEIGDILEGTKEDIEKIIIDTYWKTLGSGETVFENISHNKTITVDELNVLPFYSLSEEEEFILNNYHFYVEDGYLKFSILVEQDGYMFDYYEFRLNIVDNSELFQEEFLQNFKF